MKLARSAIVVLLLFNLITVSSCSGEEKSRLILPRQVKKVLYERVEIKGNDFEKLNSFLSKLESVHREIYSKADGHLLFFVEGKYEPIPYAIFFKENLIYEGYFQDAWTERMQGNVSLCYKMDNETREFLMSILKKVSHE
ncbi:MAG: hypothetical protein SD837_08015 [Candidatus Electrothrix scaldis]|nr:MAG: hypothetical protein SD837_08015 [Candidatus Electrothrix sp. GW3-3]